MSNSAIRYKGKTRYIGDKELGAVLSAISKDLSGKLSNELGKWEWLAAACEAWWDDYENMPPGLKDVELDDYLTDQNREHLFAELLNEVEMHISEDVLKEEIDKFRSVVILEN